MMYHLKFSFTGTAAVAASAAAISPPAVSLSCAASGSTATSLSSASSAPGRNNLLFFLLQLICHGFTFLQPKSHGDARCGFQPLESLKT